MSLVIFRQDGGLVTSSSRLSDRVPFVASFVDTGSYRRDCDLTLTSEPLNVSEEANRMLMPSHAREPRRNKTKT